MGKTINNILKSLESVDRTQESLIDAMELMAEQFKILQRRVTKLELGE